MLPKYYYMIKEASFDKVAQAKWRAYIDAAKTTDDLARRVGELNRGKSTSAGAYLRFADKDISEAAQRSDDFPRQLHKYDSRGWGAHKGIKDVAKRFVGTLGRPYPDSLVEQIRATRSVQDMKDSLKGLIGYQKRKRGVDIPSWENVKGAPIGGEEWHPINHGGERARIGAFLQGGNGHYPAEVHMTLPDGTITNRGINVHSERTDRASLYAGRSAGATGGKPAVMTGEIQGKYLYRNNDYSGGGDEYAIPYMHYDKIRNSKVSDLPLTYAASHVPDAH